MARRPTARLPCGCVYFTDREEWAKLCPPHEAETAERHERAQRDYQRGHIPFTQSQADQNIHG